MSNEIIITNKKQIKKDLESLKEWEIFNFKDFPIQSNELLNKFIEKHNTLVDIILFMNFENELIDDKTEVERLRAVPKPPIPPESRIIPDILFPSWFPNAFLVIMVIFIICAIYSLFFA